MDAYIAEIRAFACNYAPQGWAICDGSIWEIDDNTALFALIGCAYGGDCRTTMGLPNLQGRAPMHYGTGPGLTPRVMTELVGAPIVALNYTQLPAHSHTMYSRRSTNLIDTQADSWLSRRGDGDAPTIYLNPGDDNLVNMHKDVLTYSGTSTAHENRQPYLALTFCINMDGTFPPRN